MEMTSLVWAGIIVLVIVAGMASYAAFEHKETVLKVKQQMQEMNQSRNIGYFWACMEGCYEMQLIVYNATRFDINDSQMYMVNCKCNVQCSRLYMGGSFECEGTWK